MPIQRVSCDFLMASEVTAASEVVTDIKIELSDLDYICSSAFLVFWEPL